MRNITPHSNPFLFTDKEVRTATDELGEVWFVAKDVFEALDVEWKGGYSLQGAPEEWKGVRYLRTPKGQQEAIFISEPAVYRTIFRSEKPKAIEFANWVCSEVLPALRKQGHFGLSADLDQVKATNAMVSLVKSLVATKDAFAFKVLTSRLRNLCNSIGEPMPKLELLGKDRQQLELL